MKNKVFFKTSEDMADIANKSIQLMVTSPPYWDLKNYKAKNQIGYKEDYKTYLGRLLKIWKQISLKLKDDGVAIININTRSRDHSIILIPLDFINQMKKIDFNLKDILIWHKSSGIPRLRNFSDHFEYFLIFSKSNNFKFNSNAKIKNDYILENFDSNKIINAWNINKKFGSIGTKYSKVHPAIFPLEFIQRLIHIFTDEGDVVLDPFLGTGTTLLAAIKTKRICYGYEINKKEYGQLIKERLGLYASVDVEFI